MVWSFAYLALCRLIQLVVLLWKSERSKELEILLLRHELAVLRRQPRRARLRPVDRAMLAALARIRDVVLGLRRFDEFLDSLGIASNVLTERLNRLVDEGVLERVPYSERPERFEYRLTNKGRELGVALLALMQWGDRHLSDKPPRIARRRSDKSPVSARLVAKDGSAIAPGDLELLPGPGAQPPRPSTRSSRRSPKATAR